MISVAHNLAATNAQRQFGINTKSKAKSTEKLASGYKINRAADDAAGLAISEKMRRQIRGLTQAAENIQDGISLVQVADGALNETHEILQRMNELAVKAANGTNSSEDREYIQSEIDQLIEEVDRIANITSFNEDIFPLCSKNNKIQSSEQISSGNYYYKLPSDIYECTSNFLVTGEDSGVAIVDGVTYHKGDMGTMVGLYKEDSDYFCFQGNANILPVDSLWSVKNDRTEEYASLRISDLKIDSEGYVYYTSSIDGSTKYLAEGICYVPDKLNYFTLDSKNDYLDPTLQTKFVKAIKIDNNINSTINNNYKQDSLWIQMGTEAGQGMYIDLVDATASTLGVTNVDVTTQDNAGAAISTIKNAITTVSKYRSNFGAQQNRLEHGYNANMNTVENTAASESRIRDTDMAKEMVKYSNLNILEQIGHAMMAQANQSNQGVLNLLQ